MFQILLIGIIIVSCVLKEEELHSFYHSFRFAQGTNKLSKGFMTGLSRIIVIMSVWNLLVNIGFLFLTISKMTQMCALRIPNISHSAPSSLITLQTVFQSIFTSNFKLHSPIYSVSNFTTSSKSVILLLPLTCHNPVSPGLNAILAL